MNIFLYRLYYTVYKTADFTICNYSNCDFDFWQMSIVSNAKSAEKTQVKLWCPQ